MAADLPGWTALILAGGRGRRLGGTDKAALPVRGRTALDLLLEQLPADVPVVIAGPPRPTVRTVQFVREHMPFQGPVAGIAAAVADVETDHVVVLAVDAPLSGALALPLLARLADEPEAPTDAVVAVDAEGRPQPLCSAWHTSALRRALASLAHVEGSAMRSLLAQAHVAEWPVPEELRHRLLDIDTPDDLDRANRPDVAERG